MIERIIHFSIKNKFVVGLFLIALIGWGVYSLTRLPIDVTPDITNNQVQIISVAPSLAVQEVESSITAPLEVAVANIPNIIELRSISRLGLSVVTVVFKDDVDIYWARQQINERLKEAEGSIPPGIAETSLAPISTGLGEIYQYRLEVAKGYENRYTPMELRTLQDWTIRREMLGTPGVADINSYGGFVKQYEIAVNPDRMKSVGLSLNDIFTALENNNENTGSAYIEKGHSAYFIRGIGLVKSLEDIGNIVVRNNDTGMPILIHDIATVRYGNATRYGAFIVDSEEAVGGVVMMLKNANAKEVIKNVEARMKLIQKTLPEGITIKPFLNRSDLVGRTIDTVSRNLLEGALIVIFILVLFLGNVRAGVIVASVIPLSMLFAVSMMNLFGVSGNLMSLGAIDFGLIVDGAVIIVESVVFRLSKIHETNPGRISQTEMDDTVFNASKRMMSSATFGQIIIFIVYIPIMSLVGIEGKMFRPMAQVVTFALIGAAILSLTYVPMISSVFLKKDNTQKLSFSIKLMDGLQRMFSPIITFSLNHKRSVSITAIALFVGSLLLFTRLGGEFVPQLEEGDLAAGVITLQGGSLSNTVEQVKKANKILKEQFPEVKHAVCKVGAGEIPTDPTPLETGDYIITLKDKSEWTSADTREELVNKMAEALSPLAGVQFEFQQPIQMRQNELISGSKQDIAIKIFGDDLNTLTEKGDQVKRLIEGIPGIEDINVEKVTGLDQIQITYNRDRLAQYGLSVKDVNQVLRTAFAGNKAGIVYDGEKRFALVVRLDKDYRQNMDDIKYLTVPLSSGGQLPLEQVAKVEVREGPAQISRENTKRRITIGFNVRNNDVESVIGEVQQRIDAQVKLPTGYYVSYGGQFQNLQEAKSRLAVAVPIALALIFILLYFAFKSVKEALLIYTAVPMSVIGGILALWLRGMNFSISAGVGFIALFGIAVLNGIVLIAEFNRLEKAGVTDIIERVRKGITTRLRPVIITATAASLGFFPMAISTSAGAEVQKPLATVVIGGLISATILTLIVLPIFYIFFSTFSFRKMRRNVTAPLLLLVLIVCGSALPTKVSAQQRIGLKEAVSLALDSNLSVRSSGYAVKMQESLRAASIDLPKTDVSFEYGRINSYTSDNSWGVSQSFAFPTVYSRQRNLAKANVKDSEWERARVRLDVATQVKQIYWQLVYLEAKQHLLVYQDSLYASMLQLAEARVDKGEARRLELVSARSQRMEAANRLQEVRQDIAISQQMWQNLLNTRIDYLPADRQLVSLSYRLINDTNYLSDNPLMNQSLHQIEVSKLETSLEKSRLLPDLSVGFSSQTMLGDQEVNGETRHFGKDFRFNTVQVGVSLPLFYSSYRARNKAARWKEKMMESKAEDCRRTMTNAYRSLLKEYGKQLNSLNYYVSQAVPEADLIIEQSMRSYKEGDIAYSEYLVNVGRALDIKQRHIDVVNSYNQVVISLESISGKIF